MRLRPTLSSPLAVPPHFTPFVATAHRTPFLERIALPIVDMPIAAVLLFPYNGQRANKQALLPERGRYVPSIDRRDVGCGLRLQCLMHEGLGHVSSRDLDPQ